jgi:peptide/nickel transport system permease protein
LTSYIHSLEARGEQITRAEVAALRRRFGLDQAAHIQYLRWMGDLVRGDFGISFEWEKPVGELIGERLALTIAVSLAALLFSWVIAFPIGVYSATHQYSLLDYVATLLGLLGLATPGFMLALIMMWVIYALFGVNVGGLFSPEYIEAPWSLAKFANMLSHIWVPMIIVGTSGTAGLIRTMRANLLDELSKPYVSTARAKGLSERRLLLKYPIRVALNPFVSTVGWSLPGLISGATIVSVVLGLPTTGPLLLKALLSQDMYLAGSFFMLLSSLTVVGTLLSDILLAWLDPRIRLS